MVGHHHTSCLDHRPAVIHVSHKNIRGFGRRTYLNWVAHLMECAYVPVIINHNFNLNILGFFFSPPQMHLPGSCNRCRVGHLRSNRRSSAGESL